MRLHPWFRTDAERWFSIVPTAALMVALMVALALIPGRVRAQRTSLPANTDTSVIVVECRVGDVATRVLEARMRGDTVFLPTAPLMALAGLDSTGYADERSLEAASTLLHADVVFDPAALVIQFADSGTLPVSQRALRARMRALLRDRAAASRVPALPARVPFTPSALTMSYAVQRDGALAIDASSRAFGGLLDGGLTHHPGGGMHATIGWMSIPRDVAGGIRIRVAALDELSGAAGILVTNAPLVRDDTLRVARVAAAVSAGTELELFDDDVLVAADSVGDAASPRLRRAQRYGTHVVRLVTRDAAGRAHESRWVESTPDALLPRGTFRYTAAVGRCTRRPCADMMASVAYAPIDRATFSAAMIAPNESSPRAPTLRGALDSRLGDAAVLSVQRAGAGARAGASGEGTTAELRFERGAGRSFVLRYGPAGALPPSPLLAIPTGADAHLTSATGSWPLPARGMLDLAGALGRSAFALGSSASIPVRTGVIQGSVSASRGAVETCVGWSVVALVNGMWLARAVARLRSALVRVREDHRSSVCGESSRSTVLVLPTGPFSALELSATWGRARRATRPELSVALRRRIGRVALAHAELSGSDGAYVAHSDIGGTVALDALRRSVSFGIDPGGAAATVDGIVYVDDNANGRRDAGEELVPGAVVRADDASAVSDASGIYVLSGLSPDRFARLTVDSLSVEDAGLVQVAAQRVLLTARSVVRVDIALRRRAGGVP